MTATNASCRHCTGGMRRRLKCCNANAAAEKSNARKRLKATPEPAEPVEPAEERAGRGLRKRTGALGGRLARREVARAAGGEGEGGVLGEAEPVEQTRQGRGRAAEHVSDVAGRGRARDGGVGLGRLRRRRRSRTGRDRGAGRATRRRSDDLRDRGVARVARQRRQDAGGLADLHAVARRRAADGGAGGRQESVHGVSHGLGDGRERGARGRRSGCHHIGYTIHQRSSGLGDAADHSDDPTDGLGAPGQAAADRQRPGHRVDHRGERVGQATHERQPLEQRAGRPRRVVAARHDRDELSGGLRHCVDGRDHVDPVRRLRNVGHGVDQRRDVRGSGVDLGRDASGDVLNRALDGGRVEQVLRGGVGHARDQRVGGVGDRGVGGDLRGGVGHARDQRVGGVGDRGEVAVSVTPETNESAVSVTAGRRCRSGRLRGCPARRHPRRRRRRLGGVGNGACGAVLARRPPRCRRRRPRRRR